MGRKIVFDEKEYNFDDLSEQAKALVSSLEFATSRVQELNNMQALLQRAKDSYIKSLKQEMLSTKSGFYLDDD